MIPQRAPKPENDDGLEDGASDLGDTCPNEDSVHQSMPTRAKAVEDHREVGPEFGYNVKGTPDKAQDKFKSSVFLVIEVQADGNC